MILGENGYKGISKKFSICLTNFHFSTNMFFCNYRSTCHGAGRALSRAKSRRNIDYQGVLEKLQAKVSFFFIENNL